MEIEYFMEELSDICEQKVQQAIRLDVAEKTLKETEEKQDRTFSAKFETRFAQARKDSRGLFGLVTAAMNTYSEIKQENELEMIKARDAYREVKKENGGLTLRDRISNIRDRLNESKITKNAEKKQEREEQEEKDEITNEDR